MSDAYRTVTMPRVKVSRSPGLPGRWFGLVCLGLGSVCAWAVVQLSPQKSVITGAPAAVVSRLRLADSMPYLESRMFVVILSVALAAVMWAIFRTPRSR